MLLNNVTMIVLNAYMPCDGQQKDAHHADYVDVLHRVYSK